MNRREKDELFSNLIALLNEHDSMPVKFVDCRDNNCSLCAKIKNIGRNAYGCHDKRGRPSGSSKHVIDRRKKVVEYAKKGLTNDEIAKKLCIKKHIVVADKRMAKVLN